MELGDWSSGGEGMRNVEEEEKKKKEKKKLHGSIFLFLCKLGVWFKKDDSVVRVSEEDDENGVFFYILFCELFLFFGFYLCT